MVEIQMHLIYTIVKRSSKLINLIIRIARKAYKEDKGYYEASFRRRFDL